MAGFSKRIPSDSLRYLLVCVIGITAFVAIAIYPSSKSISRLETKINELQYRIEKRKTLYPLYSELKKRLESSERPNLTLPEPKPYPRNGIDSISSAFEPLVEGLAASLEDVTPDVRALAVDSSALPVRIVLKGHLSSFQEFLTRLGSVPFVTHVEEVRIEQIPGGREMEVKVWFAVGD